MNETTVDRIKALCKSKGIAISRLEKDLGFANGYIGQLRKGTINSQCLQQIAEYFGVTERYLISGSDGAESNDYYYLNDETRRIAQEAFENPDLRSLFHAARDIPPEVLKAHIDLMLSLKRKEKGEDY